MNTANLLGIKLDWAVCKATKLLDVYLMTPHTFAVRHTLRQRPYLRPSTDWAQAGPIIERAGIAVWRAEGGKWHATPPGTTGYSGDQHYIDVDTWEAGQIGPTLLIAAMRCYVEMKLGHDVVIPKELTQ